MGRRTSFNACKEAIEAGERLTRRQDKALLSFAEMQSERADAMWRKANRLEHAYGDERIRHEMDMESWQQCVDRYNAMIHMLHDVLGRTLYYDETISPAEQYQAALLAMLQSSQEK